MKNKFLIVVLLLFSIFKIYAYDNGQEIINIDSDIYDYVDILYSMQNLHQPSTTRPWTINEFNLLINKIKVEKLNTTEKKLYNKILDELSNYNNINNIDDKIKLSFGLNITPEAYFHLNENYNLDDMWINANAENRNTLLKLDFEFSYINNLFYYMSVNYGNSRYYPLIYNEDESYYYDTNDGTLGNLITGEGSIYYPSYDPYYSTIFSNNIISPYRDYRFQGPFRNYISFGNDNLNFSFSKDKLNLGQSIVGNMLIDKHVQYFDYTNLSIFSNTFKFTWLNLFFDTQQTHSQEDLFDGFKIMMATKFEFVIYKNLLFSVTQAMMYHGDTLNLTNLNPSFYFHNLNNRDIFNSIASFDFSYNFTYGIKAYFQFVVDQLKLPNEEESQEPSAFGAIIGVNKILELSNNLLEIKGEMGFTSPQLYKRDYVDFLMYNKYYTNGALVDGSDLYYVFDFDYIGFPYGGDALYAKIESKYYNLNNLIGDLSYTILAKGPTTMFSPIIYDSTETTMFPINFEKIYHIVNFKLKYSIKQNYLSKMELNLGIAFVNIYDINNQTNNFDPQINISYGIKL